MGASRRVVYLMACSVESSTMENQATQAADITEKRGMTAREAAVFVLHGQPCRCRPHPPGKDC